MKHLKSIKTLLSIMLIAILTITAISCGDDVEDPVIYTVTVMTAEGGEADASCYEVIAGEEVTLIATPESGYIFKCWMLNGVEVSRENPYTTVVNKNTVYVAKFVKEGEGGTEDGEDNEGENNEDEPNQIETFDVLSEIEKDEMVFVKGGSFKMGATSEQTEDAKADETPVHLVILSDYYISRYEVTQKFWETIMGNNPSSTKGEELPVDNVSWEECQQFIKKLNAKTGKRYSLPTEAEWEYAARGGEKTENHKFSGSNTASEVAWSDAIDGTIEAVGTKKYNELGIYDMSGNVSELCYNYYEAYTSDDQINPIGKTTGEKRVLRGGNISSAKLNCRISTRSTISQTEKQAKTGFRLVLSKPTYEVSVKASSEERGSVTIAGTTQTQYIREGGEVTLTATAKENCNFHNWTANGEEVSNEATFTIKVIKDAEYTANFITHKVTVIAGEGGTAEASKTQVEDNEKITLTATPKEGYSFVNWTVNGEEVSKEATYTATITADTEFKANFISYKITVIAGEGGTAKASKTQVGHNAQVTLTATPQEGYSFVNWTVNGEEVSKDATYTATITADTEFKANFISYKITVIASEGGTATASKTQVGYNAQVTLTATPQEGYSFVNWTVNGEEVSKDAIYTATITEDIEIKANFITHKVTVLTSEGGTATASKTQAGHNAQVTFTATPQENYSFVNWTVNGEEVSKSATYTTTITADTEFKANFKFIYSPTGTENGIGYVDLGLSVKWATCNVGADSPEEYGDYFAWGEISPKSTYNWSTYKYCNGSSTTMTQYCENSYYGTVDNKTYLELEDDAAHVNWGGKWRMPTRSEQEYLIEKCTWTWTTLNGVTGYKVTSKKNGKSIFLPAAGYRVDEFSKVSGTYIYYWSNTLGYQLLSPEEYDMQGSQCASAICYYYRDNWEFYPSNMAVGEYRSRGLPVRAVCE